MKTKRMVTARARKFTVLLVLLLTLNASQAGTASSDRTSSTTGSPADRTSPIFVFHSDEFWLNLHHFLYVLGRSANKERDTAREAVIHAPEDQARGLAGLKPKDQQIWREAVAAYAAGPSKKDLVFDDPLPDITITLARAGSNKLLTGVDESIGAVLIRAAPIYQKVWWPKHRASNRAWQASMEALVKKHGVTILAFITRAYRMEWPAAGYDVHISGYSNWAGAYSTKGDLLVLSSLSADLQEAYGLETIFHEGMHQWDGQVFQALREQARKLNKLVPSALSHGMIFFTAGEAVKRVYPQHVPYAYKFGVWNRGLSSARVPLEESWKPYLDGHGTRDEAFAELIRKMGTTRQ